MRRSKLELCEDIISAIVEKELTIDGLAFECNTSCVLLQEPIEFLMNQNIVTMKDRRQKHATYILTSKGVAISKTFAAAQRVKKLQLISKTSVQTSGDISAFSEENEGSQLV